MPRRLYVYRSNQAEQLARCLADVLRVPVRDPMRAERVVVQGRGMATWLSQQLALELGVFTNGEFLYPRNFVSQIFAETFSRPDLSSHSREGLFWGLYSALSALSTRMDAVTDRADREALQSVLGYLDGGARDLKTQQLAARITRAFDGYLVFRPELIAAWNRGESGDFRGRLRQTAAWQAALWRLLPQSLREHHLAHLEAEFHARVAALASASAEHQQPGTPEHQLPERVCLFGLSSLPPLYLRSVARLADLIEVHLFVLSPSQGWYADQTAPRQRSKLLEQGQAVEQPHELLASLGAAGADFQQLLEEHGAGYQEPRELYRDPTLLPDGSAAPRSLLRQLQKSLLELDDDLPLGDLEGDDSIAIHSCHGPMREVEVLHDRLLRLLEQDPSLAPQDVIVMAPDIERYAPLIESVFDRPALAPQDVSSRQGDEQARRERRGGIPYRIADRSVRHDAPVLEGLFRVLALVGGRHSASQLLDLLNLAPIADRFQIQVAELDAISEWVRETGIRWAIDEEDRAGHGQPPIRQNTWRFGLDRLLLGYALPGHDRQRFLECLPYDEVEGQSAELAGKLASFAETLFDSLDTLDQEKSLAEWQAAIARIVSLLFAAEGDYAWQHQRVLTALEQIRGSAESVEFDAKISLAVLTPLLGEQLDESQPAKSFLTGGVTFCAMVPMRSIPFRVVCLLGMDESAFPRRDSIVDFDLAQALPKAGDRSRSQDDRYLFLEALLSARERLLITFNGQSIHDNSKRPPSVVVEELLDHLARRLDQGADEGSEAARQLRARLVTEHPLQPFSQRYFDGADARLFSFRADLCRGAESARGARRAPTPIFERRLPPLDASPRFGLRDLQLFLAAPQQYLFERRLGLFLREDDAEVLDREPIELSALERYAVGDFLLQLGLEGMDDDESLLVLRASGKLPFGTSGAVTRDLLQAETDAMKHALLETRAGQPAQSHHVSLRMPSGVHLEGNLDDVFGGRLIRANFMRPRPKRQLRVWVEHLIWCAHVEQRATAPDSSRLGRAHQAPREAGNTHVFLRPAQGKSRITHYQFSAPENATHHLDVLCRLLLLGLDEPLHLFPEASRAYVEALGQGSEHPHVSASQRLADDVRFDPYARRVVGATTDVRALPRVEDAMAPGFEELARTVWQPLLQHLEET
ncbi:MAG: exodeoxyribonuclease V subunit gamma [Myxococcales bacterium]|nr:exodeoxyribonuclease V subunit gamma [Myxococcales bacterium]